MTKGVFAILMLLLLFWIVSSILTGLGVEQDLAILGFSSGAQGLIQVPQEEVERVFHAVREHMFETHQRGQRFAVADDVLAWVAFFVTSSITLIAGAYGRAPTDTQSVKELPVGPTKLIAFLAALGAVLTAASSQCGTYGHEAYQEARDIQAFAVAAREDLVRAPDANSQRIILDQLMLDAFQ